MGTNTLTNPWQWRERVDKYIDQHGPALLAGVLILIAGFFVARWISRLANRWLTRKEVQLEPPVRMLIVRLVRFLVFALALVIAAGTAGVDVTALVTGIGVAGLGIGLAVQGVLANLVAGLNIIFTRPFRVGEYIEILGQQGQVQTIELFSTTLQHPDQSLIIIPNKQIVGEILRNYGYIRQVSLAVGVSYGTDINAAVALVRGVLERNPRVLKQPVPGAGITTLADSSINLAVAAWTKVDDYGPARAELYQAIVEQFRAAKIEIPFPQREVRLLQ